ncbi:hypothetical protein DFP72DRAFT_844821 [Ephemerocybe angulata]|uniref:Uncharacterized protein n=1 Tax=Ephemerocybe angulata TaxID=980116 RepID=A0A8H6I831_9AGAR|nr:hypothetical protein DFP72DRAFT_844821 [Tulosesus angulatus]
MDLAHVPSANRLVDINNDALVAQDILDLLYPTLFSSGPSHVSVLIHFIADCFAIWEPTLTVPSIRISRRLDTPTGPRFKILMLWRDSSKNLQRRPPYHSSVKQRAFTPRKRQRTMEVRRGHKLQLTAGAATILERVTLPATLRPPPGPGHNGWRCRLLLWRKDQDAFAGESEYVVLATLIPTKLLGGGESVHISGRFPGIPADMKVPNSRYPDTTFRPLAGKIPVPAPITEIKEEEEEGTMPGGLGQVSGAMRIQGYNKPA